MKITMETYTEHVAFKQNKVFTLSLDCKHTTYREKDLERYANFCYRLREAQADAENRENKYPEPKLIFRYWIATEDGGYKRTSETRTVPASLWDGKIEENVERIEVI